jgi:hypothetical protein
MKSGTTISTVNKQLQVARRLEVNKKGDLALGPNESELLQ